MNEIEKYRISDEDYAEIKERTEEASPYRQAIMLNFSEQIKLQKSAFIELMCPKLKEMDKESRREYVKKYSNIFSKVKDFIHYQGGWPQPTSRAKLDTLSENLAIAFIYLTFIEKGELLNKWLSRFGLEIKVKDASIENNFNLYLASIDSKLSIEEFKEKMKDIFDNTEAAQSEICKNTDLIKVETFDKLSETIKYDKKLNPTGLRSSDFNECVTLSVLNEVNREKAKKKVELMEKKMVAKSIQNEQVIEAAKQEI